jgi:HSP20 family protein
MADFGTRRQREEQGSSNLTASERNEGLARRHNPGLERAYGQGRFFPSIFSVSPGEFFTMSPVTLMRRFTEDIDRAFGFGALGQSSSRGENWEQEMTWTPAVEVTQSGNNLLIKADLPGVNENDVKLEATEYGLVIQGERRREESREEGGWHRTERVYGHFYRLIPLPEEAKLEDVRANFRNGVLEVTVPVPELQKKHRQIPIQTSGQSSSEQGTFAEGRSRTATSGR